MKKKGLIFYGTLLFATMLGAGTLATTTAQADYVTRTNANNSDPTTFWNGGAPLTVEEKVATVKYVSGYGIMGFRRNGTMVPDSNKTFLSGTRWNIKGSAVINGEEMFLVGLDTYIPRRYTDLTAETLYVNYVPGYSVRTLFDDGGFSSNYVRTGTRLQSDGAAMINGKIMYRIASNNHMAGPYYIPKQYTQFGDGV